jgi:hypothetical protein
VGDLLERVALLEVTVRNEQEASLKALEAILSAEERH